ncbi:sugar phosphate isomerase/epimerase [Alteromonas sp. KUL49]|uniref:sugar phosphate isomerase/epimerase family protein n=1 Tax=Alteromonas sp. KUL49 TaxID=2480798 RepID=UPI00102F0B90|nr:sugar phosphate isomerase/epimerase [Alteromonas sp. KUL49]TAP39341.1 sugar phosphate isomerase/epimerase [Alteromonas sp. KUL49]
MNVLKRIWFFLVSTLVVLPCFSVMAAPNESASPKISVQLHSVRDQLSEDFEGTLRAIAEMGFDGVEFAGRYGKFQDDPEGLKAFLDELGLEVSGMHAGLPQLMGEKGERNIAFFKALGAKSVIIPHDKRVNNPEEIDALIADLLTISTSLERVGMQLGYHNHAKEFEPFNDETFWDYLAKNTPSNFILQLDIGWAIYAGFDPIALFKKYPGRTLTSHFKRRSYQGKPSTVPADTKIIIGTDESDWGAFVDAAHRYAGAQWIVVEQEEYPEGMTPLESVEASFNGLKAAIDEG